jgi:hypothetical protein
MTSTLSSNPAVAPQHLSWAQAEFGSAALGDLRLQHRLVASAAQAAAHPHGQPSVTFRLDPAARQATFKHLERSRFPLTALLAAASQAAWKRALRFRRVVVVIDPCTLSLQAASPRAGFGPVSTTEHQAFGAESVVGVLLDPSGTPLGLVALSFWVRPRQPREIADTRRLPITEKETRAWLEAATQITSGAREAGYTGRIDLQCDAGADAREVLEWFAWDPRVQVTIRCRQERRVAWPEVGSLEEVLSRQKVLGYQRVKVARNGRRAGRIAMVEVRATEVVLSVRNPWTKAQSQLPLYAVQVREVGTPEGEEPIHWTLLTTSRDRGWRGARRVVRHYAWRWRVEETFKTWKSGACQVEQSQLEYAAFQSWALILLCVAVRIERLKRMARTEPKREATEEFSVEELEALVMLRKMKRRPTKELQGLTIEEAVRWVAELGGYQGPKSSGGPPGSIVIGRGLNYLAPAVELLAFLNSGK